MMCPNEAVRRRCAGWCAVKGAGKAYSPFRPVGGMSIVVRPRSSANVLSGAAGQCEVGKEATYGSTACCPGAPPVVPGGLGL
jgi:hypothetical protein